MWQEEKNIGINASAIACSWERQAAREIGLAAFFLASLIVAAQIKIPLPFTPVPLTLQTLFVLLAGGLGGPRVGFLATASYLLLSLLGVPVLASASFWGATGGYVIGFVLASVFVGICLQQKSWINLVGGMIMGSATILLCGWLWLMPFLGLNWQQALYMGVIPFLPGDAVKTAAAIGIVRVFSPLSHNRGQN